MRSCKVLALVIGVALAASLVAPSVALGEPAAVDAYSGSQVWAEYLEHSPAPSGSGPGGYVMVTVTDISQSFWSKEGSGPKTVVGEDEFASMAGVYVSAFDPGATDGQADDVTVYFLSSMSAPSLARYREGGRFATVQGTVPGTLEIWYGPVFDWSGPFPMQREPDVRRAASMMVDVEWTATEGEASRLRDRYAGDGYFGITRSEGISLGAVGVGRVAGDDGTVWWDGAFQRGWIGHFDGHGVYKGEAPQIP